MPTVFHLRSLKLCRRTSKERTRSSDSSNGRRLRFARIMSGRFRRIICLAIVLSLPIWPGGISLPLHDTKSHAVVDFEGGALGYFPLVLRSLAWLTSDTQSTQVP